MDNVSVADSVSDGGDASVLIDGLAGPWGGRRRRSAVRRACAVIQALGTVACARLVKIRKSNAARKRLGERPLIDR